jgi:Rrf2 family transcriptional regulator, iron-sulfur cluster assembly transcription factor
MLSVTAEYALRAVLVLARDVGRPMRADEIAAALGAPRNYLAKTLNALAKAGIATSARGPLGGFALAVAPDQLTVADIVAVFDGAAVTRMCLLRGQPCNPNDPCSAHARWSDVSGSANEAMTTTIATLLGAAPIVAGDSPLPSTNAHVDHE